MIAVAIWALVAGYVLLAVRAVRTRRRRDVRIVAGGAVILLLAGTGFFGSYAVIMENYQADKAGVPVALAAAGACLLGAAFSVGCLYAGRLGWWRQLGPNGSGLRSQAPRDGPGQAPPADRAVSRAEVMSFAGFVALAVVAAGAFGFVHNQVSYTVSPEYFTRLKFDQFHLQAAGLPERLRAGMVGVLASWRMGIALGVLCGTAGFQQRTPELMRKALIRTLVVVASIAFAIALGGLGYGCFKAGDMDFVRHSVRHLPPGVVDPRAFLCAAYMHDAAYLGGVLAVPGAWAFNVLFRRRHALGPSGVGVDAG